MTWNAVLVGGSKDGAHETVHEETVSITYASINMSDGVVREIYYDPTDEFDSEGYRRYVYRKPQLENA